MNGLFMRYAMFFLLAGLTGPALSAGPDPDEEEIRTVQTRLHEAWNRHDMKAFSNLFAEDADFVNVAGAWWKGRTEIENKHASVHASIFRESTLTIDDVQIRFLTRDIALAHVLTSLTGQKTPEGAPVPPRKAILTQVLQKQNGKWLIVAAQNTDVRLAVIPPAGPPKS
jgi:uncharacterized protein (TIGR02246 family)